MQWPWSRKEQRSISVSDPVLAEYFGVGPRSYTGIQVGEQSALSLSAVYRAVALISGTVAGLPLRTLRDQADGTRERVTSVFDDPGAAEGPTGFEWTETVLLHLLLHGNAYLAHVFNGGGALAGLVPIHPLAVRVDAEPSVPGGKLFTATLDDGSTPTFTAATMTHIPALSLDGLVGLSPITAARNSLGTALAGERAAARVFRNGAMLSGMVTPEDEVTKAEADEIKAGLDKIATGFDNAAAIAVINRKLKFTPWTMSLEDAQFLQSRQFQIEEIARWFGVPPHLLMQTEKQTSWGTGVAEQNRGLARFTLMPWTTRIEQRLSRLLPKPRFVEFDYANLLRPSPEQEIGLLIQQVDAGLITVNEARRIRNMDPIEGGDVLRGPESAPAAPEGEEVDL